MKKTINLALFLITIILITLTQHQCQLVDVASSNNEQVVIESISTHQQQFNYQPYSSLGGSTKLWIQGSGFDVIPENNKVLVGDRECVVQGASSFIISCLTPDSDTEKRVLVQVLVKNKDSQKQVCKAVDQCHIQYTKGFSPRLYSIYPRATIPGSLVQFEGYFRLPYTVDDMDIQLDDIRFDLFFCDRFNQQELFWDNSNAWQNIPCESPRDFVGGTYKGHINHKFRGYSERMPSLPTLTADGSKEYDFMCVPTINSMNTHEGSPEGQIIKLNGGGFSLIPEENIVYYGEQLCSVQYSTKTSIECRLPPNDPTKHTGFLVGGSGLTRINYTLSGISGVASQYKDKINDIANFAGKITQESITKVLDFELPPNTFKNFVSKYFGYFKAPKTGNYKFYGAGDDSIAFYLSNVPNNSDPSNLQKLIDFDTWVNFRDYNIDRSRQISQEVSLVKDNFYYLEGYHAQYGGNTHFTIGVEVPNDDVKIISIPEIQKIKINYECLNEILTMKIQGMTTGFWAFEINAKASANLTIGASASDLKSAFEGFGYKNVEVVKENLDASGLVTTSTDTTIIKGYQYTVTFKSFRSSWLLVQSQTTDSKKQIYITNLLMPSLVYYQDKNTKFGDPFLGYTKLPTTIKYSGKITQEPSPPVSGTFKLSYNSKTTEIISYDINTSNLKKQLVTELQLSDKIEVTEEGSQYDGKAWYVKFTGMQGAMTLQFSAVDLQLQGGTKTPVVDVSIFIQGSNNLLYHPIPQDMLFTKVDKPEVKVKVNGVLSTCLNFDCSYEIKTDKTPIIKALTQTTNGLQIEFHKPSGIDAAYIYTKADVTQIVHGGAVCDVQTVDKKNPANDNEYLIDCNIPKNGDGSFRVIAGSWKPEVNFKNIGYATYDNSVTPLDYDMSIGSVEGPTQISSCGNIDITIKSGKGFPYYCTDVTAKAQKDNLIPSGLPTGVQAMECTFEVSNVYTYKPRLVFMQVTLDDSICLVKNINSNEEFTCSTSEKNKQGTNSGLKIWIQDSGQTKTVEKADFHYSSNSVLEITSYKICTWGTNDYVNDCQATSVQISTPVQKKDLRVTGSGFTGGAGTLSCRLIHKTNSSKIYNLAVLKGYTDTDLTCILSGGDQGQYYLQIIRSDFGAAVPSSAATSNGATSCNSVHNQIQYKFETTSISPDRGSQAGGTKLTITGVNFDGDKTQPRNLVFIGEYNQRCDVITSESTTTQITCITRAPEKDIFTNYINKPHQVNVDMQVSEEATMNCAADESDVPTDEKNKKYCFFRYAETHTPKLIYPTDFQAVIAKTKYKFQEEISFTGTNLEPSAGQNPQLTLFTNFTKLDPIEGLYDQANNKITFKMPALEDSTSQYYYQINIPNKGYPLIEYQQELNNFLTIQYELGTLKPKVSTFTFANNKLSLTGTDFSTTADILVSLISLSDSKLRFTQRIVGGAQTNTINNIEFVTGKDSSNVEIKSVPPGKYKLEVKFLQYGLATIVPTNQITVNLGDIVIDAGIESSYGGREIKIKESTNAFTFFAGVGNLNKNKVTVCDFPCEIVSVSTTGEELTCRTPQISTKFSLKEYDTQEDEKITSVQSFGDASAAAANVIDEQYMTFYTSKAQSCWVGLDFGENIGVQLDSVQFYPENKLSITDFRGAKILGTNDITDIATKIADFSNNGYTQIQEIKEFVEGWNIILPADGKKGPYRYIIFNHPANTGKGCDVAELKVLGKRIYKPSTLTDTDQDVQCDVVVNVNGQTKTLAEKVTYKKSVTPKITQITPDMGSSYGNENFDIIGSNFGTSGDSVVVTIDKTDCKTCNIVSDTKISCTTDKRAKIIPNTFDVKIKKTGSTDYQLAINTYHKGYTYVDSWSDPMTWGGENPPGDGDSVIIPSGQTVLYDAHKLYKPGKYPIIKAIIIEDGSLIFDDTADLELHAHFVFASGGRIQIGTEEKPFQHKLTITLYGKWKDKQLPLFGNKVFMVHNGVLDIHGIKREPVWSVLYDTAQKGDTTLKVTGYVDWKNSEYIIVAPTELESFRFEDDTFFKPDNGSDYRQIHATNAIEFYDASGTKISSTPTTTAQKQNVAYTLIPLAEPLSYRHYSKIEKYSYTDKAGVIHNEDFDFRCEVGLLTRNIVIRGDPADSWKTQYGGHTMVHGTEENGAMGRIEYAEFVNCGQQTILGRYSIHFHLNGPLRKSYVIGNSVHHSLARITTIHGTQFLRVINNIGYKIFGHAIFVEDGSETQNTIEKNLVVQTIQVWTLTKTDMIPAAYWITHPYNFVRHNHAAGGEWFGFWYELFPFPEGPSANPLVFPDGQAMGVFEFNVAHHFVKYGFRGKTHIPRNNPKIEEKFDINNPSSPDLYSFNPSFEAKYTDFVTWGNGDNGFQYENVGHLTFERFKIANNRLAGMILWSVHWTNYGNPKIKDIMIVGLANSPENIEWPKKVNMEKKQVGLIVPNSEGLYVENVRFYNFRQPKDAQGNLIAPTGHFVAIESCGRCNDRVKREPIGVITTHFKDMYFTDVDNKIFWERTQQNDIFVDMDGTIVGKTAPTDLYPYYITPFFIHNFAQGETNCYRENNLVYDNSLICNKNNVVRPIYFKNIAPDTRFKGIELKSYQIQSTESPELYINDKLSDENTTSCFAIYDLLTIVEVDNLKYKPEADDGDYTLQGSQSQQSGYALIQKFTSPPTAANSGYYLWDKSTLAKPVPLRYRYLRFVRNKKASETAGCSILNNEFKAYGRQYSSYLQTHKLVKFYKFSWGLPFITGKTYNIHWLDGLDWDKIVIHPTYSWKKDDKPVVLRFNYSDNRELFEVCRNYGVGDVCKTSLYEYNNTNHCSSVTTEEIKTDVEKYLADYNSKPGKYPGYGNVSIYQSPDWWKQPKCSGTPITVNNAQFGSNYHDKSPEHFYLGISGQRDQEQMNGSLVIRSARCVATCPKPVVKVPCQEGQQQIIKLSEYKPPVDTINDGKKRLIVNNCEELFIDIDSEEYDIIEVNGNITFSDDARTKPADEFITLKSKLIWVREGAILGGTKENPLKSKFRILLTGGKDSEQLLIDRWLDPFNKVLAVTGKIQLYGQMPDVPITRLTQYANAGDNEIRVHYHDTIKQQAQTNYQASMLIQNFSPAKVLRSWQRGDKIVISGTSYDPKQYETRTISSVTVDSNTNELVIKFMLDELDSNGNEQANPLKFDHYGDSQITDTYQFEKHLNSGQKNQMHKMELDMRATVGHLSRNIVIEGDDQDDWGCHVFVAGFEQKQLDMSEVSKRGLLDFQGVEIRKCGQRNTQRASLDITKVQAGLKAEHRHKIIGCAIHTARGWGMNVQETSKVDLENSIISDCEQFSYSGTDKTNDLVFKNNLIVGLRKRNVVFQSMTKDNHAGIDLYGTGDTITMNNNIILNVESGPGLVIKRFPCKQNDYYSGSFQENTLVENSQDENDDDIQDNNLKIKFYGNQIGYSDYGLFLTIGLNSACGYLADATLYKIAKKGILEHEPAQRLIIKRLIVAECQQGVNFIPNSDNLNKPYNKIVFKNLKFIGIGERRRTSCQKCFKSADDCSNQFGLRFSAFNTGTEPWPKAGTGLDGLCVENSFSQLQIFDNVIFENFRLKYTEDTNTASVKQFCTNNYMMTGKSNYIDHTAPIYMINTRFLNSDHLAKVKFIRTSLKLLGWTGGCGNILCTGDGNTMITDVTNGIQMMAYNDAFDNKMNKDGKTIDKQYPIGCKYRQEWDGFECEYQSADNKKINQFMKIEFESTVPEFKRGRLVSPVNITLKEECLPQYAVAKNSEDGGVSGCLFRNIINQHSEWKWDGGLPKDQRLQRFNAIIPKNTTLFFKYTAQQPTQVRYQIVQFPHSKVNNNYYSGQTFTEFKGDYSIIIIQIGRSLSLKVYVGKVEDGLKDGTYVRSFPLKKEVDCPTGEFCTSREYDLWQRQGECGRNIFYYDNRTLAFVLNRQPNCMVHVVETNSVMVTMRFEVTLEDFYKNNHEATFIDKISAFLQISSDRVRIVKIRQGSVIIDFFIDEAPKLTPVSESQVQSELSNLSDKLKLGAVEQKLDLPFKGTVEGQTYVITKTVEKLVDKPNIDNKNDTYTGIGLQKIKTEDSSSDTSLILSIVLPIVVLIILGVLISIYIKKKMTQMKFDQINLQKFESAKQYKSANNPFSPPDVLQSPPVEKQHEQGFIQEKGT